MSAAEESPPLFWQKKPPPWGALVTVCPSGQVIGAAVAAGAVMAAAPSRRLEMATVLKNLRMIMILHWMWAFTSPSNRFAER